VNPTLARGKAPVITHLVKDQAEEEGTSHMRAGTFRPRKAQIANSVKVTASAA